MSEATKFEWTAAMVKQAADGDTMGTLPGIETWSEDFFDAVLAELEHRMIAYQKRDVINGHIDGPNNYAARAKTLGWLKQWWFHPPSRLITPNQLKRERLPT